MGKYSITLSNVLYFTFIITSLLISPGMCVKREDFKTCSQSGFCTRQRAYANLVDKTSTNSASPYRVIPNTIEFNKNEGYITAKVIKTTSVASPDVPPAGAIFNIKLDLLKSGSVRMNFGEAEDDIKTRFDVAPIVLDNNTPETFKNAKSSENNNENIVSYTFGEKDNETTIVITLNPLKIELLKEGEVVLAFNQNGYFNFEEHRHKDSPQSDNNDENTANENTANKEGNDNPEANAESNTEATQELSEEEKQKQEEIKNLIEDVQKDMWEESFKSNTDSKPYGPESIGFDITFTGFKNVYGIPQHTGPLNLKTTRNNNGNGYSEPYRLYNLDVFEYEIDSPMAIYGAIPFMLGHKRNTSAGVLFVNSSEMWVDVEQDDDSTHTHWMAESGKMDIFFFVGKNPKDVVKKYMNITGKPQLPQYFAIAYHQCRWNYNDEADVLSVDSKFDEYGIPYDVLWLDIEHTDGKRYFTWDYTKFPDPEKLQRKLGSKGRKMVTIVDPHIKVDNDYYVYKEAKDQDFFVHNNNDQPFDGWCWPGSSSWIDYLNPKAFNWYTEQYKFDKYKGSTEFLYTWNDMNEPSVFSGPETTMPKDNLHYGKIEHRDVHNVFGELYHKATFEAHKARNKGDRPFILSRAFFVGSQRYGAIWTGDNDAKWDHLQASLPMLLSIGVSGLPFCGADIGGFFNNPEKELYIRWYQAAAFQPFVRGHSHIETKRREPWLYDDETISLVRSALYERYNLLPYWYTLFKESSINGLPMMRPMFLSFPDDENTYAMEDQYMAGESLLVKPVISQGQKEITVYLPKLSNWYDYMTKKAVQPDNNGNITIPTTLSTIPVFLRGGSIIPQRLRHRRSSTAMRHDPYTLLVALDNKKEAYGELYIDDGKTEDFKRSFYIYRSFKFANNKLTVSKYQSETDVPETEDNSELMLISERIERVIILGLNGNDVSKIILNVGDNVKELEFTVDASNDHTITIKYPAVEIKDLNWFIEVVPK